MSMKKQADPSMTRKGFLAHPGSILLGLAGIAFAAYIFNFQGIQTYLDSRLGSLNFAAQSHGSQLVPIFLFVLPVLAVLLGGGIIYILFSALTQGVMGSVKESRKKKAKALARQAQEAALAASGNKPPAPEPMVLVRPARINVKDVAITHIAAVKQ